MPRVYSWQEDALPEPLSGADGALVLPHVAAGTCRISARLEDIRSRVEEAAVVESQGTSIVLRLPRE